MIHKSVSLACSNVITDPNRRYVTGLICNSPVILANVYGPNWDNDSVFWLVLSTLPYMSTHFLILGGISIVGLTLCCIAHPPKLVCLRSLPGLFYPLWMIFLFQIPGISLTHQGEYTPPFPTFTTPHFHPYWLLSYR